MEITIEQAREYLASIGITLPDFVLEILVSKINSIDECLIANGVSVDDARLIKIYLLTLLSIGQADRYVTSERAPSGAARSYKYGTLNDRWRSTLALLRALDKFNCAGPLVPEDPFTTKRAWVSVSDGGCGPCGGRS